MAEAHGHDIKLVISYEKGHFKRHKFKYKSNLGKNSKKNSHIKSIAW